MKEHLIKWGSRIALAWFYLLITCLALAFAGGVLYVMITPIVYVIQHDFSYMTSKAPWAPASFAFWIIAIVGSIVGVGSNRKKLFKLAKGSPKPKKPTIF